MSLSWTALHSYNSPYDSNHDDSHSKVIRSSQSSEGSCVCLRKSIKELGETMNVSDHSNEIRKGGSLHGTIGSR